MKLHFSVLPAIQKLRPADLKFFAAGLASLGFIGYLFSQTQASDIDKHNQRMDSLRQMKHLGALLAQQTLESRDGLLSNYDPIVQTTQRLDRLVHEFEAGIASDPAVKDRQKVIDATHAYQSALAEQVDMVERFKARNAVLKNSLTYVPIAGARLTDSASAPPEIRAAAGKLLRELLILGRQSDDAQMGIAKARMEGLSRAARGAGSSTMNDVENLQIHAKTLVQYRTEVDTAVRQLVTASAPARSEDVYAAYTAFYSHSLSRANSYRFWLCVVCALLLCGVSFAIRQIRRASQQLSLANETLEDRVQQRTGELSAAKESLDATMLNLQELMREMSSSATVVASTSSQLAVSCASARQSASEVMSAASHVASISGEIADSSGQMAQGSEQQAETATQAMTAVERLSSAIERISANSTNQRNTAENVSKTMTEVVSSFERMTSAAKEMTSTAKEAASVASTGGSAIEQAVAGMDRIRTEVEETSNRIAELGQTGQQIGAIVVTIDEIAAQTNMLALNAAIEAARAGDHGRGFAVVADEVRKLAERASTATREISALITEVQQGVSGASRAMESSRNEVEAGVSRSVEAGEALGLIRKTSQRLAQQVGQVDTIASDATSGAQQLQQVAESIQALAEANAVEVSHMETEAGHVDSAVATVASITQEFAASAQAVNATIELASAAAAQVSQVMASQSVNLEEIDALATELAQQAGRARQLASRFGADTTPDAPPIEEPRPERVTPALLKAA